MRIVLATPLFPPDIADPAPYTYELARRLSTRHTVSVVTYGRFPEEIPGVSVHKVDKRLPTLKRGGAFRHALREVLADADVLYLQSGISAELPALLVRHRARVWWRQSAEPTRQSLMRTLVKTLTLRHTHVIAHTDTLVRPEILPLEPRPEKALAEWEAAWTAHVSELEKLYE